MKQTKTLVINNFSGRLTRVLNGDINSGFAKFSTSFGYDPFSKPYNLTWLYQPDDIKGSIITDAVIAAQMISPQANTQMVYGVGSQGKVYLIDPNQSATTNTPTFDTPSVVANISSAAGALTNGADIDFYLDNLYVAGGSKIVKLAHSGVDITSVIGVGSVSSGVGGILCQFQGSLYYANGNNIGQIDSTGAIVDNSVLSPSLPQGLYITDLDVTPDGNYMIITASYLYPNNFVGATPNLAGRGMPFAVQSYLFYWNGSDGGVTAYKALPSFPATALSSFLDKRYSFVQDAFGASLYEGDQKLLTMPDTLAPMPNAAAPNGTFLTWISPEGTGSVVANGTNYSGSAASLYYYGRLDAENPPGLWRLLRINPSASNKTYRTPLNMLVNNYSLNLGAVIGWGKHYMSVWEYNTGGASSTYHFYRFLLPSARNNSPIDTNAVQGVYETQTQLFSQKIGISAIRVYTEGTATGNGFQLDLVGPDGSVIPNGTFNYTFASGTDPLRLQGSMERINFNPGMRTLYGLGARFTNTGTTNMTIKKVEIDWTDEGK